MALAGAPEPCAILIGQLIQIRCVLQADDIGRPGDAMDKEILRWSIVDAGGIDT